VQYFSIARN